MLIIIPSADRTDNQLCARSLDLCARLHHGDHLAPVTPGDSGAVLKSPPGCQILIHCSGQVSIIRLFGFI